MKLLFFILIFLSVETFAAVAINVGGQAIVNEGAVLTRTVTFTDDVDTNNDGWSYVFNINGSQVATGSIAAGNSSFDITYTVPDGDAIYIADVTITDVSNTSDNATGSFLIFARNVPPRATITSADSVSVNTQYSIVVSVSDPGQDTVNARQIDWGDGSSTTGLTHTYTSTGAYLIRVWISDEDGFWLSGTKQVTVN